MHKNYIKIGIYIIFYNYSGTPLPLRLHKVSLLKRCPYFRVYILRGVPLYSQVVCEFYIITKLTAHNCDIIIR